MIKNYYYLIAGILGIFFAVSHAWNGQTVVLPALHVNSIDTSTKTTFFYVWHIITAENAFFGLTFLFMSLQKDLSKVRFAAWVIASLMIVRLIIIFGGTLFYYAEGLKNTLIDSVAIILYIILILLGARQKDKAIK
jgi:hypothetical protein